MKNIKILFLYFVFILFLFWNIWFASNNEANNFVIIPESDGGVPDDVIIKIWNSWWHVWDQYDEEAYKIWWSKEKNQWSLWKQISSWVVTRDTLIDYLVYALRFLSQLAILIWAIMCMYAWYTYIISVLWWWEPQKDAVKYAIFWILIVIFAYAIMRILTQMFLL